MIAAIAKVSFFLLVSTPGWSYILPQRGQDDGPLFLTPYIKKGLLKEGREAAKVTPLLENVASYSGFLTVDETTNKNLFFWYFPTEKVTTDNSPVVLWLQGGPGVTSMYGLLSENGPYQLMDDGSLKLREYRWTKDFDMIYIDSPVGTGFSFANPNVYDQNEKQVSADLYQALLQFFTLFPNLAEREFFIAGESYAGRYIPVLGERIDTSNPSATLKINLAGLMIGDGVVDNEFMVYGDYLAQHGLIDLKDLPAWEENEKAYREALKSEDMATAYLMQCGFWGGLQETGVCVYNFLETNNPNFDSLRLFFNTDVRQKLHVGNSTFNALSLGVYYPLERGDFFLKVSSYTQPLLEKYRVMHYNGQLDIICHYPMARAYTLSLEWSQSDEFRNAEQNEWYAGQDLAGFVKSGGNLTLVMVRDAGHMVPHDQPKWAYDLVTKFTSNQL